MKSFRRLKESLKETYQIIVPQNKCERRICAVSLLWFLCFSLYFAFNVTFTENTELIQLTTKRPLPEYVHNGIGIELHSSYKDRSGDAVLISGPDLSLSGGISREYQLSEIMLQTKSLLI